MLTQATNQTGAQAYLDSSPAQPSRPMERIQQEADRLARLGYSLQSFLDRFHGAAPPVQGNASAATAPVQIGYRNEIDRLSANADILDAMIQSLHDLG